MLKKLIIFLSVIVACYGAKYSCYTKFGYGETCRFWIYDSPENDSKIEPVAPSPLHITKLDLNGDFPVLAGGFCEALPNLKEIEIGHVSLKQINNFTFLGCDQLEHINIRWNSFKNIEKNSFKGLKKLQKLQLEGGYIFDADLSDLTELKLLQVDKIHLSEFSADILRHHKNLKTLSLQSNHLFDLDVEGIMKHAPNLEEISLVNNNFNCSRLREIMRLLKKNNISPGTPAYNRKHNRDYTPEFVYAFKKDYLCLTDMQWSHLYLVPQMQSKIETLTPNIEEKIMNLSKTIEEKMSKKHEVDQIKLSQKHDEDLLKITQKLDEEKESMINVLTKEFDEKLKNERENRDEKMFDLNLKINKIMESMSIHQSQRQSKVDENFKATFQKMLTSQNEFLEKLLEEQKKLINTN